MTTYKAEHQNQFKELKSDITSNINEMRKDLKDINNKLNLISIYSNK
jgi:hypothetical protein